MKETDLASKVADWMKAQHWEVYQEVQPNFRSHRADIVGLCDNLTWVVECKTSMTLALLEQALGWKPYAHFVSVAVPTPKLTRRGRDAAKIFLNQNGIGLIEVSSWSTYLVEKNGFNRKIIGSLRSSLNDRQKDYARAGSNGSYWTPFKQTCSELKSFVSRHPGTSLKAAIDGIPHHYSSDKTARACISKYIQAGTDIIPGVSCEREGNKLCLYPQEASNGTL
jgi:hypothetical protein